MQHKLEMAASWFLNRAQETTAQIFGYHIL